MTDEHVAAALEGIQENPVVQAYERAYARQGGPQTEYALLMAGGGMQVRNPHPDVERIYPVAEWIRNERENGAKVYRRRVVVIEDWTEVEEAVVPSVRKEWLTSSDPEPPPGTTVEMEDGQRWTRYEGMWPGSWLAEGHEVDGDPETWTKVAGNYGPVRIVEVTLHDFAERVAAAAKVHQEEDWFIAQATTPDVASQGRTEAEARANLREAVELYLTNRRDS